MPFSRPSIDTIYRRVKADMESRVTNGIKIPRISMLGIMSVVFSGVAHLMYGYLDWIYRQMFLDTADGDGRQRWSNILGIPRKAATYTTGFVSFTGAAGYVVVEGVKIANEDGYEYETQADFTIGTTSSVEVVATVEGVSGNTDALTLTLSSPDVSVNSEVTVVSGFDDGRDLETEEEWTTRLIKRFQTPPNAGSVGDYERWALEVAGVERAWCLPLYSGVGTLAVVVSQSDLSPVGSTILADVEAYIEVLKPVPAAVTYLDVEPKAIEYDISIEPNNTAMRAAVTEAIEDLHASLASPGDPLLLSSMYTAIGTSGVDDYAITEIYVDSVPNGVADIELATPYVPVFDSINFTGI